MTKKQSWKVKIRMFKLLWLTGEEVYNLRSEIQWVMYFMRVGFFILIEFFSFLIYWCFPFESRFSSFHQWNHVLWGVFWTSGIVGFLFHGCFVSVVFFCYLSNSHHFMLPLFCPCCKLQPASILKLMRINICFCLCILSKKKKSASSIPWEFAHLSQLSTIFVKVIMWE